MNQYRFKGKKFQPDPGLAWNHQDWCFFDPQLGRWHVTDPEIENGQESWTPYSFGYDNALRFNDPNGRCPGGCPPPDPKIYGTISQHQPNAAEKLSTAIDVAAGNLMTAGAGVAARVLYSTVDAAYTYGTGFFDKDKARTLEGHSVNRNEYQMAASGAVMTVGSLGMDAAEVGAAKGASRLGDLTRSETKAIQQTVNEAGRPLEVVGSAAKGTRRGVGTDLLIGKGAGTRSDIDYMVGPSSQGHYQGLEKSAVV